MAVVQTYMSRIFRAPLKPSEKDTVIYVNFGWFANNMCTKFTVVWCANRSADVPLNILNTGFNTQNNQAFPAYNPVVMVSGLHRALVPTHMNESFECIRLLVFNSLQFPLKAEWMSSERYEQMCAEIQQYLAKNSMYVKARARGWRVSVPGATSKHQVFACYP